MDTKLKWCFKQKKGIKIVTPSDNLCEIYLQKSKEALNAAIVNAKAKIFSWTISASYYAKYFSIYALLSKIGVKSEIHECTIEVFNFLFRDVVGEDMIRDIKTSKNERIEFQYYTKMNEKIDAEKLIENTRDFINKIEEVIDDLTKETIDELRNKLELVLK